jgi:hypothetical protein
MIMIATTLTALLLTGVDVHSQHLEVALDPSQQAAAVRSTLELIGGGELRLRLTHQAQIAEATLDGNAVQYERRADEGEGIDLLRFTVPPAGGTLVLTYAARFADDVAAGEKPGQIHNFSVEAHIGEAGIFLSDGSAWHPQPLAADEYPALHRLSVSVRPIEGWAIVASGEPLGDGPPELPRWNWAMPRPIDSIAIAGNRHALLGRIHRTPHGPIEVVMHVPEMHRDLAKMFLDAACEYLDLYTPLLGPFPYKRFSIVENFFSSGFAYPGFTLLGPRVVAMAPRSLMPGFLDHELIHNWWGNGVYVDPADGNWCEALTSYCANYYRRIADGGEEAGREYRRGTLMKLSADPESLDNAPLGDFGSADPSGGGPDRFVGYDKGAFLFMMLEFTRYTGLGPVDRSDLWAALRRFASEHMGRRAGWGDIQTAFESAFPIRDDQMPLDEFFDRWVRRHTVPQTPVRDDRTELARFRGNFPAGRAECFAISEDQNGQWMEIDPQFYFYRVLPAEQIVPLIGGTLGPGGVRTITADTRPQVTGYLEQFPDTGPGENLLIIGTRAITQHADLIARSSDPLTIAEGSFTVGGKTYDGPDQAVLHTMQHPDRPGRFITVFHSNGEAGWARLRLIIHYARDTTVIWEGKQVLARRTFEPDRRIPVRLGSAGAGP